MSRKTKRGKSTESLNMSKIDIEMIPSNSNNSKDQPLSAEGERLVLSNPSRDATSVNPPRDVAGHLESIGTGDHNAVYQANIYSPQAQTYYYGGLIHVHFLKFTSLNSTRILSLLRRTLEPARICSWSHFSHLCFSAGYENASGEWGEHRQYFTAENMEIGSPGIYNDNPSLVFHNGYGYNPQMPFGAYSPVTTPLSSVRGDGHLYSGQQIPFSGPSYYQQLVHPNMPYFNSNPVSESDRTTPVGIEQQGDGRLFGPRPGYSPQFGSTGRGSSFHGNSGNASFYDMRQGFDGFGSGALWSDWLKSPDGQRSLTPFSPAVSPQPVNFPGPFGRNAGMVSQQQRPLYGSGSGSHTRRYPHNGIYQSSSFDSGSFSTSGSNDRWLALDKVRRRARDSAALCSCNGAVDILSEQNRGPRALKPKNQATTEHGSSVDLNKDGIPDAEAHNQRYNRADFVTEYNDAKFFVIKSYSEDNVHKSIKYGVWASTPNGNRKLDAAYHEAKEKQCPVNASAQFCGVCQMVGPVDFDKSVDYWQQDKWSGQFPVKWHIIKDVPNSQFRHIILENNDSKPVTNSRDTQEVKLEQGLEMLNIFKNYETNLSILDDFDYYEERQKAMQERKARQQVTLMAAPVVGGNEYHSPVTLTNEFVKQMSKSFSQAVRLEESSNEGPTEKIVTDAATSVVNGAKAEDATTTTVVTTVQNS
ncbi:hypothetical protein IFM89_030796 [Coptis chinensis]|uniref:YTH domain-containing family protein n=1 Tax=Coptis chinensis TaxID=261450 RepID=A0A835M4Z8_9MAGN|nr:hypothetical protein IFM89_030796 [Coptis chinensis]